MRLPGQRPATRDELNARFWEWLQTLYHSRVHEGIGMTPNEGFVQGSRQVRLLDPTLDLDRLFYAQLLRAVRKDGTVRLHNQLYEVDLSLRGLEVRPDFDPWTLARVELVAEKAQERNSGDWGAMAGADTFSIVARLSNLANLKSFMKEFQNLKAQVQVDALKRLQAETFGGKTES